MKGFKVKHFLMGVALVLLIILGFKLEESKQVTEKRISLIPQKDYLRYKVGEQIMYEWTPEGNTSITCIGRYGYELYCFPKQQKDIKIEPNYF